MYRNGRFLVPNCWHEPEGGAGNLALLVEEASGRILSQLPAAKRWDDQLAGLTYWCGDRILSRADSYHGPSHGGRHPWVHWLVAGDKITRLPGKMDLGEFTSAYEVPMETPFVAGFLFERTEKGVVLCYDLRKPRSD